MKKLLRLFFSLLFVLISTAVYPNGTDEEFVVNHLKYRVINPTLSTVCLYGYAQEPEGNLSLSTTVEYNNRKFTVTEIGKECFKGCDKITAVTLPSQLEVVGEEAFRLSTSVFRLNELILPPTLTTIGARAFYHTNFTGKLQIPQHCTHIDQGAFTNCMLLTSLVIPEGISMLNDSLFENCRGLRTAELPASLTSIGASAFGGCFALENITYLGHTEPTVGNRAFLPSPLSTSRIVSLPNATGGFTEEKWGREVRFEYRGETFVSGGLKYRVLADAQTVALYGYVKEPEGNVVLPSTVQRLNKTLTVTQLAADCFADCGKITAVTLPSALQAIGSRAFEKCTKLETLPALPAALKRIDRKAFSSCLNIGSELRLPGKLEFIGEEAFSMCPKLKGSLTLPVELLHLGAKAFRFCEQLTGTVVIPSGITTLSASAFEECRNLTGVQFHNRITSIGASAFKHASKLGGELKLPTQLRSIENSAFSGCGFTRMLQLPASLEEMGEYAFSECKWITELSVPQGISVLNKNTFAECDGITKATLPASLTTINEAAFLNCNHLITVDYLGKTEPSIAADAFKTSTRKARMVYVPNASDGFTASHWGDNAYLMYKEFIEAEGLRYQIIDDTHTVRLFGYSREPEGEAMIPSSIKHNGSDYPVTEIASHCFTQCSLLTAISFPPTLKIVGEGAFFECTNLKGKMEFPTSLLRIEDRAFKNCGFTFVPLFSNHTEYIGNEAFESCHAMAGPLTLPNALHELGEGAFAGCSQLTGTLILPSNVSVIKRCTFSMCNRLSSLELNEQITEIGDEAFAECTAMRGELKLPASLATIGESAFWNSTFGGKLELPVGLRSLGEGAFYQCHNLTEVSIGEGINAIPANAFKFCLGLKKLKIPASVAVLGNEAFMRCEKLTEIEYCGKTEPTVGQWAFAHNNNQPQSRTLYLPNASGGFAASNWGRNVTILYGSTGVNNIEGHGAKIYSSGKRVVIESEEGKQYAIIDLSGKRIDSGTTTDQRTEISLSQPGIYVVSVNSTSTKVYIAP